MNTINRLVINVTKEDISGGCKSNPQDCMIARAIKRKLALHHSVSVCYDLPSNFLFREQLILFKSNPLHGHMLTFDREEKLEPFSFILEWEEGKSFAKVILLEKPSDEEESVALPSMRPVFQKV